VEGFTRQVAFEWIPAHCTATYSDRGVLFMPENAVACTIRRPSPSSRNAPALAGQPPHDTRVTDAT